MANQQPAAGPSNPRLQPALVALTVATGLVDALSYLGLGHVFVANMTGNIVFLGFTLSGAPGPPAALSVVALASFLVGAVAGGRLATELRHRRRWWLTSASGAQTALVATAAALAATGSATPDGHSGPVLVGLLAAAMGMQTATARSVAVPDLTTTVLTLTLTGLAADSAPAGGQNPRTVRRLVSVAAMLTGALAGGALMVNRGFTATVTVAAASFATMTGGLLVRALRPRPPDQESNASLGPT